MHPTSPFSRWKVLALTCLFTACISNAQTAATSASQFASQASSQYANKPQVGSSLEAIADPPITRPNTRVCEVTLLDNQAFADFNNKPFNFTPPANCHGPWAKVILTADFSIQPGVQFDRTGQVFFGGVNIYFGSTAEPLQKQTDTWHVERDLTDYASLFQADQTGYASLGNIVGTDGLNSVIFGTFKLEFYEANFVNPAPRVADAVLPIQDSTGNSSIQINSSTPDVTQSFTLPRNTEAAYLDVIAESQNAEEQWFFCVPTDIAGPLNDCQNTAFREVQVSIDGKPAGLAPVYPFIYTGGLDPGLWSPVPGVQTLNFLPYRVDLTPFAGTLNNGDQHTVGVSVFNAYSFFTVTAQLLLYRDHGRKQVSGAVIQNTLTAPNPNVTNTVTLDANGLGSGTVTVTNTDNFTISGYVDTSHGRVQTKVEQQLNFKSVADITNSSTAYIQKNVNTSTVHAKTTTSQGFLYTTKETNFSYPISVSYTQQLQSNGDIDATTVIDQKYQRDETDTLLGFPVFHSSTSNEVSPTDTAVFVPTPTGFGLGQNTGQSSKQTYTYNDTLGNCYSRTLTVAANVLTGVKDGAGCRNRWPF